MPNHNREKKLLRACHIRRASETNARLLNDVTLEIRPGDQVGLSGPSGSGKSILLQNLALLDPCSSGEIYWDNVPVNSYSMPSFRRHVALVAQQPALFGPTVEADLRLPYSLRIYKGEQFNLAVTLELLNNFGKKPDFLAKQSNELSGGETQIAVLVRALQLGPSILLLDEPTSALDKDAVSLIERFLLKWVAEPNIERAFVWVTHDQAQLARIATRLVYMQSGQLTEAS